MEKRNWETQKVVEFLIRDENCRNELRNKEAHQIRRFVCEDRRAPQELFESFKEKHAGFSDVDWYTLQAVFDENLYEGGIIQ